MADGLDLTNACALLRQVYADALAHPPIAIASDEFFYAGFDAVPHAAATAEELAESMGPAPSEDERMKSFFFGRWRNGEPVR